MHSAYLELTADKLLSGIRRCLEEGCWVNEESYEVRGVNTGDSTILSQAPRKGRQSRAQQVYDSLWSTDASSQWSSFLGTWSI